MRTAVTSQVFRYDDPVEGFSGWLAYSGNKHRLAAGGLRVRAGCREQEVVALAEAMQLKQRLLGLAVDGAKAGIDYDPRAPGKAEAVRRFLQFLRPHLLERFSMGPDMGTTWAEIEAIARKESLPSVKAAVARAQGLSDGDFRARLRVLGEEVDGLTLGQRRAGHALAHAALAAAQAAGGDRPLRAGIQGFGNLGRSATLSLAQAGVVVTAVSDEHACLAAADGLDLEALLTAPHGAFMPTMAPPGSAVRRPEHFFELPFDVIVLAACQDAVSADLAPRLQARVVVVGANLGLSEPVELLLHGRGVLVVPDFVGGCGGSASMDALFGPPTCPTATAVLDGVAARMGDLVGRILERSGARSITPRQAALELCARGGRDSSDRPYGAWTASEANG